MSWVVRLCAIGLIGLTLSSCARPFPERPGLKAGHPYLYSVAFGTAVTEAVALDQTGRNYYQLFEEVGYPLSVSGICDRDTLNIYLVRRERGCFVVGGPPIPGCENISQCAGFRYNAALFSDPRIRNAATAALRDPCGHLAHPDQVNPPPWLSLKGLTVKEAWRIMLCDSDRVYGDDIIFNESTATITMTFQRGRHA